jgi:hypothetical protein
MESQAVMVARSVVNLGRIRGFTHRNLYALPVCSQSMRGWLCRSGRATRGLVGGWLRLRTSFRWVLLAFFSDHDEAVFVGSDPSH